MALSTSFASGALIYFVNDVLKSKVLSNSFFSC